MAKAKDLINKYVDEKIQTDYLEKVMGDRFSKYAKYIIQDRAIPDVRDGLKPVQRRILYAMWNVGMVYGTPYKKSARIVGEVIGKFHPHGDSSVYEALVRMSQSFKINVPLIDMHGNNGSIDGDSAAAMRYTEARLSQASMYLLEDIDKKTVPFVPNYDDAEIEPVVLPAKFPNILVNGADGISAGYATNIPPHNLNETINLTIARIKNPNITVDEAMQILPGPDFPTGGLIIENDEIKRAFETGRGKVIIRSKTTIEDHTIIISEIPYEVNKSLLVKKIDQIGTSKKVDGIIEVRDESDKEGLRIVIETRPEANPDVILNYLFKNTDLQLNFSYNLVAIVDRSPKVLGILDVIDAYILHTKEVITNRSNFNMDKAQKRLHIVEGFHKLSSIINEVVETIKNSKNKADAKLNIINKYGFSEAQAEAIVTLQLYRLTNTDIQEFEDEKRNLQNEINKLQLILSNETALKKVIISELEDLNAKIVTPRKSEIVNVGEPITIKEEELIIHEDVHVIITRDGYIKKLSLKAYQASIGVSEAGLKENDFIIFDEVANTMDTILLFTSLGSFINLPVYKIPELKYKELGAYIGSLFDMPGAEKIISINHLKSDLDKGSRILISTKQGKIKFMDADVLFERKYRKGLCMKLVDGDEVIDANIEEKDMEEVVVTTKLGLILKYAKSEIPTQGGKSVGVKNCSLKPFDEVTSSVLVSNYYKEEIILLTNRGGLKRISLKNLTRTKRGNRGTPYLKTIKSNPYYFVKSVVTNPTKFKDSIELFVLSNKREIKFKGTEIPKDTFENGAQVFEADETPLDLYLNIIDDTLYHKAILELSSDLAKSIQEVKEKHPNSLIDELGEIIDKQTSIYDYIDDADNKDDEKLKDDLF